MKKHVLFLLALLCSSFAFGQQLISFGGSRMTDTAYAARSMRVDSVVRFVRYRTVDSNKVVGFDANGFLVLRTKGTGADSNVFYTKYRADTSRTAIYGQLASRVKYADTSSMLNPYLKKVDTASLSTRIDARVKYIDTAAMLVSLVRVVTLNDTAAAIRSSIPNVSGKVNYTDTAAMIAPYYRTATATAALALKQNLTDTNTWDATKKNLADTALALRALIPVSIDTTSLSNRINARVKYTDTATMLGSYLRKADTASLSNRINTKLNSADTSSLSSRIDARVKYSDTSSMLSPYYRTATATAALALKQNYADTTTWDATKKNLADTALALRAIIPAGIDTTSLSNRIDARVKYADTSSMLSPYYRTATATAALATKVNYTDTATMLGGYLRKVDTASLSTRIDARVKYADTATMLSPYYKTATATAALATKVNYTDTATMLGGYLRKIDTSTLSTRIDARVKYSDTASMLSSYYRTATATAALALKQNNTDTTTWDATKKNLADTALALRALIPVGTDTTSLSNRIDARVKYTDTASMLAPYATDAQVALKLNIVDTANMRIRPIAGSNMTITGTYPNVTFAASGGTVIDTTSLSNRIDARVKYTDTSSMLSPYLRSAAAATTYVPYTGATSNVNLGEFEATVGQVTLDQTPTQTAGVGVLRWNDSDGTADLGLKGGNVTLQIGQEEVVRVVNKTGANLLESQYHAVYVSGAQGQRLKVGNAIALADSSSAATIGLVTENIDLNQEGFITTNGLVRDINTTGSLQGETWNDGDLLFLSGTTAGQITNVKPIAPTHTVIIGYVVYAHANNGKIFVKVDNGYELDELHNVRIVSAANNEGLFYDSAAKLWENKSISTVLGYTPANNATVVKYADTASMLASYLRKVDTASLSTRINTKLNSADTASLSTRIDARVKYSDTSTMLGGYLRKVDTASLSNRIDAKVGYGTLTTNYVPKATSTTAIGNSQIFDNGTSVGIGTATPNAAFKLDVNGKGRFQTSCLISSTVDYGWPFQVNNQDFRILSDGQFGRHTGLNFNTVNWNLAGVRSQVQLGTAGSAYENQLVIICQEGPVRINPYGTNYTNRPVIIGNTTARTEKLQVDGTSYFSGSTLVGTGTANASALLEINSTTQGLGLPSMTTTQQNAIATPRTGLEIYNSTLLSPHFYNGSVWTGAWNKRGNSGTTAGTDFIGTTDNVDLVFRRNSATAGWLNHPLFNTSYGVNSLPLTSTGGYATAIGHGALSGGTTGNFNIAIGYNAGTKLSSSASNIAIGRGTLGENGAGHTGNENVAIGEKSMFSTTTATRNAGYGWFAGYNLTTGNNNTFLGPSSGGLTTTGSNNISVGYESTTGTTGSKNLVVSYQGNVPTATASNQLNIGNVLWGADCSGTGTTAAGSLSIGVTAPNASAIFDIVSTTKGLGLPSMTTTQQNAIGTPRAGLAVYNSTLAAPTYYNGTAWSTFGGASGWGLTGNAGTSAATNFIGTTDDIDLMFRRNNISSGRISTNNAAFGNGAGAALTSGGNNSLFGAGAGAKLTNPSQNTYFGFNAGSEVVSGFNNIYIGAQAASSTGHTAGNKNLVISHQGLVATNNGANQLNIGNVLWGVDCSATGTAAAGRLGVGTNAPNASAILDLNSTTQGFLPPRMTNAQILAIATPAAGLTVYNTDLLLLCFFNGTIWQKVTATPM